jgi:hypothetical protein
MFSSAHLSLAAEKMVKNSLVTGGLRDDFTESKAATSKHFQCQNRRFRAFEAGYWKNIQNLLVISKEQAKTFSLIFSSTKQQKIVKLSAHVQKVPLYYYKLSKNIHLVTQYF